MNTQHIMIEATKVKLSKKILATISINEVLYAEATVPGGMGNSGGIILYIIKDGEFICYETNIYSNESTYLNAEKLLLDHAEGEFLPPIEADKVVFNLYDAGMGNRVLLNKNVTLKKGDAYNFIYKSNNKKYKIYCSVVAVFDIVASLI